MYTVIRYAQANPSNEHWWTKEREAILVLNLGTNYDCDCLYHWAWPEETNGGFMRKRRVKQNVFRGTTLSLLCFP